MAASDSKHKIHLLAWVSIPNPVSSLLPSGWFWVCFGVFPVFLSLFFEALPFVFNKVVAWFLQKTTLYGLACSFQAAGEILLVAQHGLNDKAPRAVAESRMANRWD